jgi:hypothetical protein
MNTHGFPLSDLAPVPCMLMRGGTSRGPFFLESDLPQDPAQRDRVLLVRGIDPQTGHYYDDTKRYIEAAALTDADRHAIFEGNARRVFPRLDVALTRKGR